MSTTLHQSIYIGLGGLGIKSIFNTKSMFQEKFGTVPPCLGFLGIDTVSNAFDELMHSRDSIITPCEMILLSCADPVSIYHSDKEKYAWMPERNVEL